MRTRRHSAFGCVAYYERSLEVLRFMNEAEGSIPPNGRRVFARKFVVGLTIYFIVVAGYVFALRLLTEPLLSLYNNRLAVYALISLGLIVAQGIILDIVTSFLAEQSGIVAHEE